MKKPQKKIASDTISGATVAALHQLAFEHSLLPHIISVVGSGQVYTSNTAACELLGYSRKELLGKNIRDIFDVKAAILKKMIDEPVIDKQLNSRVAAVKKDGRKLPCEITSAVFSDPGGIELSIITLMDRRQSIVQQHHIDLVKQQKVADDIEVALQKSDDRLSENSEWLKFVAKTSYDIMWDWDIASNTVWVGDSIKEVFGYSLLQPVLPGADISLYLLPEDQKLILQNLVTTLASRKKVWKDSCMVIRQDGSLAATTSRASIVRDAKGKAIRLIGATQDVSKLKQLEKNLKAEVTAHKNLHNLFNEASRLSFEGRWDWNLLTNEFFLGEGFKKLFGHTSHHSKGSFADKWSHFLHPDDKEKVLKSLQLAIDSTATSWEQAYRFICLDGSIAQVLNRSTIIRDADNKAYRMIGAMQDISKFMVLEKKLDEELQLKKQQIENAAQEARETERLDIAKELHDNVNQLLGASQLCMEMAKQGGEDSVMLLSRSSTYTQSAIEAIRKLTHGLSADMLTSLGLRDALDNIARDTMEIHPLKISCVMHGFKDNHFNEKFKVTIFRIVQEQLNNIIKHANASAVAITVKQSKMLLTLSIADNGIGFDLCAEKDGIGVSNIKSRAATYNGHATFNTQPGAGCELQITFSMRDFSLANEHLHS